MLPSETPAAYEHKAMYASAAETKVFYHTCKSKCCPSCGNRGTLLWQREQWSTLPDVPFVGIVLTMPNLFWPVFKTHRRLQHDLPALGAAGVQHWAWNRYRIRLCVIVIQHTFGGHLNYNPHLHMLASAGGLKTSEASWVQSLDFDRDEIMSLWRFAVASYLTSAHRDGLLEKSLLPVNFDGLVLVQARRRWNIHITSRMSKKHFLGYAGRYIRRLPKTTSSSAGDRTLFTLSRMRAVHEGRRTISILSREVTKGRWQQPDCVPRTKPRMRIGLILAGAAG